MARKNSRDIPANQVRKNDWADHKTKDLDPRRVSAVRGDRVWLSILGTEQGPFPRDNYVYYRDVLRPIDVVCSNCNAGVGEPCTRPTNASRVQVPWFHNAREDEAAK